MTSVRKKILASIGTISIFIIAYILHFSIEFNPSMIVFPYNGILTGVIFFAGACVGFLRKEIFKNLSWKEIFSWICLAILSSIILLLCCPSKISGGVVNNIDKWSKFWGGFIIFCILLFTLGVRLGRFKSQGKKILREIFFILGLACIIFHVQLGSNDIVQKELLVSEADIKFLTGGDMIHLQDIVFEKNNPTVYVQIKDDFKKYTFNIKANYPAHYKGWDILLMACDNSSKKCWAKLCFVYDVWKYTFKIGAVMIFLQVLINLFFIPILKHRK